MCWPPGHLSLAAEAVDLVGLEIPAGASVVERVQALSHADIHRLAPRLALPGWPEPVWMGTRCLFELGETRRLAIQLGAEELRRLGSLSIVSTPMQFIFEGWTRVEREVFLRHMQAAFQQGGG